jgi:hypothetical protein
VKVAGERPRFWSEIVRRATKSRESSAKPKLREAVPSPAVATTCVATAGGACTSPAPARRASYPATRPGSAVFTIAARQRAVAPHDGWAAAC